MYTQGKRKDSVGSQGKFDCESRLLKIKKLGAVGEGCARKICLYLMQFSSIIGFHGMIIFHQLQKNWYQSVVCYQLLPTLILPNLQQSKMAAHAS